MARPDSLRMEVFLRGQIRDEIILTSWRNALRDLINPDTGVAYTEDEIARATQQGSRWFIEADAIDLLGQAQQSRAIWLVDQLFPKRAATEFLKNFHGPLWLGTDAFLLATGGSGTVTALAQSGVVFVGSTTIGDPVAQVGRDENGKLYQVLTTVTTPANGTATLTMQGIDVGTDTNLGVGRIITWVNPPLLAQPTASVATAFTGGTDDETDAEFASRVEDRIRHRPSSGNAAHFRAWARESSNAVENAFIYASAYHAGSVHVAVTQKRGTSTGPTARVPSVGTVTAVRDYLVPPASPVVPSHVFVVVTGVTSQPIHLVIRLSMKKGAGGGWTDVTPWPGYSTTKSTISLVTDQTHFRMNSDTTLPNGSPATGANVPTMMVWNDATSRWEKLNVTSVTLFSGNDYDVVLGAAPAKTLQVGDVISPHTDRLDAIGEAIEAYFDELGPGEVVNLTTDIRATRAARFPRPNVEAPLRAGQAVIARLADILGGALADAELTSISANTPNLPTNIADGPNMLTLGDVSLFSLD